MIETMTIENMTAAAILAVACDEPERVFGADPNRIDEVSRALAMRWHPDRNPAREAGAVLAHLTGLKAAAAARAGQGRWRRRGAVAFDAVDGRRFEMNVLRSHGFELGEIHVATRCIAYAVARQHADLFAAGQDAMARLACRDDDARNSFEPRLPRVLHMFETADRLVIVLQKSADQILLRDLIAHCGGALDPRHVAWIVSDLESLACYLGLPFVGLVHPALGPETILASPRCHSVTIVGGWPYAVALGAKLRAAPGRFVDHAPKVLLLAAEASERLTLEALRLTACACLGHASPVTAQRDARVPQPFARWLLQPSADTAIEDYDAWALADRKSVV